MLKFTVLFFLALSLAACTGDALTPKGGQAQTVEASATFKTAKNVSVGNGIWAVYPRQGWEILLYPKDGICHIEQPGKEPYREAGVSIEPIGFGTYLCLLKDGIVKLNAESGKAEIRIGLEAVILEAE